MGEVTTPVKSISTRVETISISSYPSRSCVPRPNTSKWAWTVVASAGGVVGDGGFVAVCVLLLLDIGSSCCRKDLQISGRGIREKFRFSEGLFCWLVSSKTADWWHQQRLLWRRCLGSALAVVALNQEPRHSLARSNPEIFLIYFNIVRFERREGGTSGTQSTLKGNWPIRWRVLPVGCKQLSRNETVRLSRIPRR